MEQSQDPTASSSKRSDNNQPPRSNSSTSSSGVPVKSTVWNLKRIIPEANANPEEFPSLSTKTTK